MKFTTIAKASLAIGILATGAITSTSQSAHAKSAVTQQSESDLKLYYNGPSFEHKKVTGFKYTDEKGSFSSLLIKDNLIKFLYLGLIKTNLKKEKTLI